MAEENTATTPDPPPVGEEGKPPEGERGDPGGSGGEETLEAVKAKLERAVAEEKKLRKRSQEAETKLSEREKADLTEQQKVEKERDDASKRVTDLETENRSLRVQVVAGAVGIRADLVDLAAKAVDWDEIEDPSDRKQLERHLKALIKDRPSLSGANGQGGGGEGNEQRGSSKSTDMNALIRRRAGREAS